MPLRVDGRRQSVVVTEHDEKPHALRRIVKPGAPRTRAATLRELDKAERMRGSTRKLRKARRIILELPDEAFVPAPKAGDPSELPLRALPIGHYA
jgi:hypothetical protein